METAVDNAVCYRFGPFELHLETRELLKDCMHLPAPDQAIRLLELLVAHAPRLVTRQQVREALWPPEVTVDFESGINSAMRRLRVLLGDADAQPIYIATIPRRGYRFIAPVEAETPPQAQPGPPPMPHPRNTWRWWAAAAVALALWAGSGWAWRAMHPALSLTNLRPVTTDGGLDLPSRPASAAGLVYYLDRNGGGWTLMRSDGTPANAEPVAPLFPGQNTRLLDISRPAGDWLLGSFVQRGTEAALWRRSPAGGDPVRLGNIQAYDAIWSHDGQSIYYSHDRGLWTASADGSHPRRLARVPATPDWLALSPDGMKLRFTSYDQSRGIQAIWEWRPGKGAHPLPAAAPQCCGGWTADGNYFLYSQLRQGMWQLWAQRLAGWPLSVWPWLHPAARQISFEPRSTWGAYTGWARHRLIFYEQDWQDTSVLFDTATQRTQPLLPQRSAIGVAFSRDGRQLVYFDPRDSSVWAADVDPSLHASRLRQLSADGAAASFPTWSPDGKQVAMQVAQSPSTSVVVIVPAPGGPAQPLPLPATMTAMGSPSWSPVADAIAVTSTYRDGTRALAIVAGTQVTPVPGSRGYGAAQWSPDGRWLSAVSGDQHEVALYRLSTRRWQVVAHGRAFGNPQWSRDGAVYFQDLLAPGQPLYRYRPGAAEPELAARFTALLASGVHRCAFYGFAPDGALILELNRSAANLYAATLNLP